MKLQEVLGTKGPSELEVEFSGVEKLSPKDQIEAASAQIEYLRKRKLFLEEELLHLNDTLSRWHRVAIRARLALTPVEQVPERGSRKSRKSQKSALARVAEALGLTEEEVTAAIEKAKRGGK